MYIPTAFREDDRPTLVAFMRAHSFITLVSILDGAPIASHVPVAVLDDGDQLRLIGHVARANPHWHAFGQAESLAVFTGAHAYVSPSLYEKRESVPTWNYIAVHASGAPRMIEAATAPEQLEAAMRVLVATYEGSYQQQWDSLPEKFRAGMLRGVVGFEMPITRLEGKYKLSQNRSLSDQERVADALVAERDPAAHATGLAMQQIVASHMLGAHNDE